jgi:hypothetical protein
LIFKKLNNFRIYYVSFFYHQSHLPRRLCFSVVFNLPYVVPPYFSQGKFWRLYCLMTLLKICEV